MGALTTSRTALTLDIQRAERNLSAADERVRAHGIVLRDRATLLRARARRILPFIAAGAAAISLLMALRGTNRGRSSPRIRPAPQALLPVLAPILGPQAATLLVTLAGPLLALATRDPPAVPVFVDLHRFLGHWYEVARLPTHHQRACGADVTADYRMRDRGIEVVSRCRRSDGTVLQTVGTARVADRSSNARLKLSYAPTWLQWLPQWFPLVWSDYWILEVGADYDSALVGTPDRRDLWILSRKPRLERHEFDDLVARAAARGFDVARLRRTRN